MFPLLVLPDNDKKTVVMSNAARIELLLRGIDGREGDKIFKELFHILYDRFFRIAIYYLKREEWAQEVVLDIFYKLWDQREKLSDINNFDNYCFILVKNAALNYLEKETKHTTNSLDEGFLNLNYEHTPENNLLDEELLEVYVVGLDELPPKCREVFILIREEGLKYAEVAERLNISVKTVDAQLQKAVSRLKERINNYFLHNE